MTTIIEGGYVLLPVSTLGQVLKLACTKSITCFDVRVFLALVETNHIRTAENAHRRLKGAELLDWVSFSKDEVKRILGASCSGSVGSSLRRLERAGIATFSDKRIEIFSQPQCELLPSARRMPIPRRILRYLAQEAKRCVIFTALSYMARGLFSRRGAITSSGRVKVSFIERLTGLSKASVHRARRELIKVGVVLPGVSKQWQLNRFGSFFTVNLSFKNPNESSVSPRKAEKRAILTPLGRKKRPILTPPIKKQKPSYENKPETLRGKPLTGAQMSRKGGVDLGNLNSSDIRKGSSLAALYRQAVERKWFSDSQMNQINFVAAAIKAVRKSSTPVKLFIWLIRNDFKYLSNTDEDKALEVISVIKQQNSESFD